MASPKTDEPDTSFPPGDPAAELHPETDKSLKIDPISAEVAKSLELKEQVEAAAREERKNKEAMQTLKKTVVVSGILAVVVGVVFTIVKKKKEKQLNIGGYVESDHAL